MFVIEQDIGQSFTSLQTSIIILNHYFLRERTLLLTDTCSQRGETEKAQLVLSYFRGTLGIVQLQFHSDFHFVAFRECI